ncbi:MAG: chalcone isomerase family protein [Candidatus Aminicenantes bacterium]|nr:chalcone isomerase family protein [Candidatus Aminicenantes bacterium]
MSNAHRLFIPLMVAWTAFLGTVSPMAAETDQFFNPEIRLNEIPYRLVDTGVMYAKALFIKVTVCRLGYYAPTEAVEKGTQKNALLIADEIPKIMQMHFQRKLDQKQLQQLFEGVFDSALQKKKLAVPTAEINGFFALLQGVEKGDVLTLMRQPGGHLQISFNGRNPGPFEGPALSQAIWGVLTNSTNPGLKPGVC